LTHLTQKNIP
jgi:hypothetical protein